MVNLHRPTLASVAASATVAFFSASSSASRVLMSSVTSDWIPT